MDRTIPHPRKSPPPPRGWTILGLGIVGWAVLVGSVNLIASVLIWGL